MKRAAILVLQRPPYYGHDMAAALVRMGYRTQFHPLDNPRPGDVMVTWNRHETRDRPVKAHEAAGRPVKAAMGRGFAERLANLPDATGHVGM